MTPHCSRCGKALPTDHPGEPLCGACRSEDGVGRPYGGAPVAGAGVAGPCDAPVAIP